jgi:hypothetical protein
MLFTPRLLLRALFGLDRNGLGAERRQPDRAARVLLAVIAKEPHAVLRALARK